MLDEDQIRDGANWYAYVGNNPLRFTDPTGLDSVEDPNDDPSDDDYWDNYYGFDANGDGDPNGYVGAHLIDDGGDSIEETVRDKMSQSNNIVFQVFENLFNGLGFRTNNQIEKYIDSPSGKFVNAALAVMEKTEWAKTKTGQSVITAVKAAYSEGKVFLADLQGGGMQLGWGPGAVILIDRKKAEEFMEGKGVSAVVLLAHEGSHYSYATRDGILSFWYREFEYEGYRISDILSMELRGVNWEGEKEIRSLEKIIKYVDTLREIPYWLVPGFVGEFNYWNNEDVGR